MKLKLFNKKPEIIITEIGHTETHNDYISAVTKVVSSKQLSNLTVPYRKSDRVISLQEWKDALTMAKNPDNPNRVLLYDVYDNIMIDSHLSSIVESRILRVLRSKFRILNLKDGETDLELTRKFEMQWFHYVLRYAAESVFYGFSLIELNDFYTDKPYVKLISRRHVVPEKAIVKKEVYDTEGISYADRLAPFYLPAGNPDNLGLLFKAAPLILAKKYALASWSDFNEKFGIPFRYITTPSHDDKRKDLLGQILDRMGNAGWAVLQEGEVLQLYEANAGGAVSTFESLIDRLNKEVSKLILGQTATTEHGESGTYGSLKVMEAVADDRHESDRTFIKYLVNNELIPRLQLHGFLPDGIGFDWDDTRELSVEEQIKIINDLSLNYIIPADYVTEKTGIPISGLRNAMPLPQIDNEKKKIDLILNLPEYPENTETPYFEIDNKSIKDIEQKLLDQVYDGKAERFSPEYFQWLTKTYMQGINKQFKAFDDNPESFDHSVHASFEANIFRFSGAKTLAALHELKTLLKESKTYHDFQLKAKQKFKDYNENYMQAEYQTAVSTAIGASRYYDMEENKDILQYWEYRTVGDDRVREAHRKLNGMVFKADDSVWDKIYPPNGWRCRCEVIAHREIPEGKRLNTENEAIDRLVKTSAGETNEWENMVKDRFNVNRAKTATAFAESNFYVKNLDNFKLGIKDFYGSDKYKWNNLDKSKFPEHKPKYKNNADAKKDLLSKLDNKNRIVFKDYIGRAIILKKKTITSHLKETEHYKERYKYAGNVQEILKSPDEVWLNGRGGKEGYTYTYIKFYRNYYIAVIVEVKNGNPIRIKTFYDLRNDSKRNGILIEKMR